MLSMLVAVTSMPPCRPDSKSGTAVQVAEGLRTLISGLYGKYLAPDGRAVDYASLAHDPGFRDYVTAASELTKVR